MWIMKDYLELRKEELKKRGNKGFTLMEMLIVVAIIAVLIAIAIPVFTSQLEKSREATDAANIRAAYAEVSVAAIDDPTSVDDKVVTLTQQQDDWQNEEAKTGLENVFNVDGYTCDISGVGQGKSATIAWVAGSGTGSSTTSGHCTITIA